MRNECNNFRIDGDTTRTIMDQSRCRQEPCCPGNDRQFMSIDQPTANYGCQRETNRSSNCDCKRDTERSSNCDCKRDTERSSNCGCQRETERPSNCDCKRDTERSSNCGCQRETERSSNCDCKHDTNRSSNCACQRETNRSSNCDCKRDTERSSNCGCQRETERSSNCACQRETERSSNCDCKHDTNRSSDCGCQRETERDAKCCNDRSLAMVYAESQCLGDVYDPCQALFHGTLFPCLDKPMCDEHNCIDQTCASACQKANFALWEMRLYLDTHPCDSKALKLFNRLMCNECCQAGYAAALLPDADNLSRWMWTDDPWPWDYQCCEREV